MCYGLLCAWFIDTEQLFLNNASSRNLAATGMCPTLENRAPHPVFDGPASASITAAAAIAIAMYAIVYRNMVLPDDSPFPSTSIIQAYSQWPP